MLAALSALALAQAVSPVADPSGPIVTNPATMSQIAATYLPTIATSDECTCAAVTGTRGEAITVSRSSSATCTKSDGTLVTCSADQPRVEADGLLVEASGTNLALRSEEFDSASWTKTNITVTANAAVAPDGATTADKLAVTASGAAEIRQDASIASTSAVCSVFLKQGSGATDANRVQLRNQTTGTSLVAVDVNLSTGAISYSIGSTGASVQAFANGFYRVSITAAITSGDTLRCSFVSNNSSETAGEYVYAYGAQLEAGSIATSYTATAGTSATRAADVVSTPKPASMTDTAGCVAATVKVRGIVGTPRILTLGGYVGLTATTTAAVNDGTTTATAAISSVTTARRLIATWSGSTMTVTQSGGTAGSDTYDGSILASTIYLGSTGSGSYLNGWLSNIQFGKNAGACQ